MVDMEATDRGRVKGPSKALKKRMRKDELSRQRSSAQK